MNETIKRVTHTPGPWNVLQGSDERDFIVAEATGNTVAEPNADCFDFGDVGADVRNISLDEAKANARLIAAAPDLLEAAQRLMATNGANPAINREWREAFDALVAAVAKAEGAQE